MDAKSCKYTSYLHRTSRGVRRFRSPAELRTLSQYIIKQIRDNPAPIKSLWITGGITRPIKFTRTIRLHTVHGRNIMYRSVMARRSVVEKKNSWVGSDRD